MDNNFKHGDTVWVVERDEDGFLTGDYVGLVFIAAVEGYAILANLIIGIYHFDDLMRYYLRDCANGNATELYVYNVEDCYKTGPDAINAIKEEQEE